LSIRSRQQGFAAVIMIALVALIIIGVLLGVLTSKSPQNQLDERSFPALAAAQQALIAYAAANPTSRGRLPCPDTTNTGVADLTCGAAGVNQLGRLPWKTLGLTDLRDGSGECLWYAVSGAFKQNPPSTPVNSDTNGQFIIVDGAGNTIVGATPQTQVIAVVFAPGPGLSGNDRTAAGTTQCGGNTTASNYLDATGGVDNAAPAGGVATFVAGQPSNTFNDRLLYITPTQFFPPLERRVAAEIKKVLFDYYATNAYYPYAHDFTGAPYDCTPLITRGLLPLNISAGCPGLADWAALPPWISADQWHLLTYYTVAPACTQTTPFCTGSGYLTVNNVPAPNNNKQALVIEAGRKLGGQVRPSPGVVDYLDGAVNTSGTDTYEIQSFSPSFDDTIAIVAP
jgi:hypothetical protein